MGHLNGIPLHRPEQHLLIKMLVGYLKSREVAVTAGKCRHILKFNEGFTMKIEIEVSSENEGTASPWWMILDPSQNMSRDVHWLNSQITGPFFSRAEADRVLKNRAHHFSPREMVFCASGRYTITRPVSIASVCVMSFSRAIITEE